MDGNPLAAGLVIARPPLERALEQPQLYALGLEAIRRLAGAVWTDHNVHDPGVTVLEIASYVATDLSFRAKMPLEDLLAVPSDNALNMRERFSSARTLLTNRPVTIRDYRKLLIDMPGVRNAWLKPAELTYFADHTQRKLLVADPGWPGVAPVRVKGLYEVRIDYSDAVATLEERGALLANVRKKLQAHRNLCEDFLDPVGIERQEFQICGELELEPGRDVDVSAIQAEIFFKVQEYLAPSVPNYGLAEMKSATKPDGSQYEVEEIFNGPRLPCGFIKDDEVDAADLRTSIRLSDVINLVMDVKGVRAVRELLITPRGATVVPDKWVLPVTPGLQPTLARDGSRLVYYKDGVPVTPVGDIVERTYKERSESAIAKFEQDRPDDLPIPLGRPRHLGAYYSLQNHFPATYGIGEEGLAPGADARRRALANQLKAYLLFFDQVLADYCAQLEGFGSLFSTDPAVEQTYFYQAVDTLRGFADLYDVTLPTPSTLEAARQSAEALVRARADEAVDVHEDRRHRFLDHLIARYAERFHEYASAMQSAIGGSSRMLRRHKCRFLQAYPETAGDRGAAYDYTAWSTTQWNSTNVSGLERRLCQLLDIGNPTRRDLSVVPEDARASVFALSSGDHRFQIVSENGGTVLLRAPFGFPTAKAAHAAMTHALEAAQVPSAYVRRPESDGSGTFVIVDAGGQTVAESAGHFADEAALTLAIDDCLDFVRRHYGRETLYVIESLLLRSSTEAHLLPICADADCVDCSDDDPYSYRIHVVLPADAGRFTNMAFREFVESVIRAETPAHILPKVCWIGREDQQRLEVVYRAWLEAGANAEASGALERLIAVLYDVKSVYPEAKLAGCDGPEGIPMFLLGQKALGTKPADE